MLHYRRQVEGAPRALARLGLEPKRYLLATVHRAENTDSADNLREIFAAFGEIQSRYPVVVALHPRTRKLLDTHAIPAAGRVRLLDPVSYLEMVELEMNARMILTDSGGVQKEAYFVATPCITLREETEWVETVASGRNRLCGASRERIVAAFGDFERQDGRVPETADFPYGRGDAASRIALRLLS